MITIPSPTLSGIATAVGAIAFYAASFWRIFKRNPGNRVIECGLIAIMVVLSMAFISRLGEISDWLFFPWLILVLLLCFSTLFFFVQSCVRAFRTRKEHGRKVVSAK